jgi:ribonuclease G
MQQLIISRDRHQTRVALLEDGRPVEFYVEPLGCPTMVGNIYKGRVDKVLAGMDASFVDIGLDRNGFLAVDEADLTGERSKDKKQITSLLQGGREVQRPQAQHADALCGEASLVQPLGQDVRGFAEAGGR